MTAIDRVTASQLYQNADARLVVDELSAADERRWDEFVRGRTDASPHHLLGWRTVIAKTYGYRSRYLIATCDKSVVGVMPLFEVPSLLQGFHFTTLPGGICAASGAAGEALVKRAKELVIAKNARFLAIRDSRQCWDADLITDRSHCSVSVDVSQGSEAIWKRLKGDFRRLVRKARAEHIQARTGIEQLDRFYTMFATFSRDFGTPVIGKDLLSNVATAFRPETWLLGMWQGQSMVGGGLQFTLGDAQFGIWGGSLHKYFEHGPNYLFYWEVIDYACQHGCKRVDLGRSRVGSGQHHFKLRWQGEEIPLYQQFYLHRARRPPVSSDDGDQGRGRLLTRAWKRLPLSVTRALGPRVRYHVPFV